MENIKLAVDYGALGILFLMSILVVGYSIERYFFFKSLHVNTYRTKSSLERDVSKNLTIISLMGSNAPYVGLLGTVGGIMVVFYDIGMSGGALDTSKVIVGLALALKVTAAGLIVAIPATMIYGGFMRKVDVAISEWEDEIIKAG
ncbi:TonB-system energizer ExbB [Sulfurospirillum barnesii]|uniref:Outer membrane transport energization protein ExbB n=1 Tax=Sulfurospirillum barnesii (strain ATCC 700032 / DSM 10660 / SES-3) TaxID=760154 RepID=I3XY95_SULBS|nr:TonB-system energizer ExbB [Sulfurospirillum barnesii]AFL68919.1 outer membrane transport energization protein ExbB [Sulfurospirillum barnesii SES-3]